MWLTCCSWARHWGLVSLKIKSRCQMSAAVLSVSMRDSRPFSRWNSSHTFPDNADYTNTEISNFPYQHNAHKWRVPIDIQIVTSVKPQSWANKGFFIGENRKLLQLCRPHDLQWWYLCHQILPIVIGLSQRSQIEHRKWNKWVKIMSVSRDLI